MKFVITFEPTGGSGLDRKTKSTYPMESEIINFLQSKSYGIGVEKFHLVLQLLIPEQAIAFPSGEVYRPRKKIGHVGVLLEVVQVLGLSEEDWKKLICKEILGAVMKFPEIKVKNFDHLALHEDLNGFFVEKGWIN